jgi:hypothetical protein
MSAVAWWASISGIGMEKISVATPNPDLDPLGRRRRSGRFGEFDRNAGGGDAPQRRTADVCRLDRVDLKIEIDNGVGVVFLSFADQRLDRLQTFGFGRGDGDSAPTGGRFDAAD